MRRRLSTLGAAVAAGALVLGMAGDAAAFCRSTTCRTVGEKECPKDENDCPETGAKLFWPTSCVSYAMNRVGTQDLDPVETRNILRKTFGTWSDVPCPGGGVAKFTFQEREPVACKRSEYNKDGKNVNVVLFQDDDWKYRGIDGTLAKTSVTYNDETGEIYDADIEVNTANNTVTISDTKVEYDFQAIMTHEVGHFIGIAHSPFDSAVMFASYSPGSTAQRKLTEDDIEAVCAIYPPDSKVACNTEPRNGFSASCEKKEEEKGCSVASLGAQPQGSGTLAAMGGIGVLFGLTATRLRRSKQRG